MAHEHPDTAPLEAPEPTQAATPSLPERMENAVMGAVGEVGQGLDKIFHPEAAAAEADAAHSHPAHSHAEAVLAERGGRPASVAEALASARASVTAAGETLKLASVIEHEQHEAHGAQAHRA